MQLRIWILTNSLSLWFYTEEIRKVIEIYGKYPYYCENNFTMSTLGKARIDLKLLETQKNLIKRAARLSGKSLTEFLVSSAEEKAIETIKQHEKILLSKKDQEIFFEAIMNPPKPSKNLLRAAADFKEYLKSQ